MLAGENSQCVAHIGTGTSDPVGCRTPGAFNCCSGEMRIDGRPVVHSMNSRGRIFRAKMFHRPSLCRVLYHLHNQDFDSERFAVESHGVVLLDMHGD